MRVFTRIYPKGIHWVRSCLAACTEIVNHGVSDLFHQKQKLTKKKSMNYSVQKKCTETGLEQEVTMPQVNITEFRNHLPHYMKQVQKSSPIHDCNFYWCISCLFPLKRGDVSFFL